MLVATLGRIYLHLTDEETEPERQSHLSTAGDGESGYKPWQSWFHTPHSAASPII